MDLPPLDYVAALMELMRASGGTKFQTADLTLELEVPRSFFAANPGVVTGAPTTLEPEDDFDPGKAYQDAIKQTADALAAARAKEESGG